jgi:hypothetical protein
MPKIDTDVIRLVEMIKGGEGQQRSHDDTRGMLELQAWVTGNHRFASRNAPAGDDCRE